jgi:PAS domain S-box-containing protein
VSSDFESQFTAEEAESILRRLAGPQLDLAASRPMREVQANGIEHRQTLPPLTSVPSNHTPLTADMLLGLLEAIPDALVITDASGRIVLVNAQTERLFGYRREELLDRPVEILVPMRLRQGHVAQRDSYIASPHVRPMGQGLELTGQRKDGHEVPVEISLSPLHAEGRLLIVSSIRDATERRKGEGSLRKMEKRYRTLV